MRSEPAWPTCLHARHLQQEGAVSQRVNHGGVQLAVLLGGQPHVGIQGERAAPLLQRQRQGEVARGVLGSARSCAAVAG